MRLTVSTERLILRTFTEGDALRVSQLAGDYDVSCMVTCIPHPYPPEAAEGWILLQERGRRCRADYPFAIDAGDGIGLVGAVGLHCTGMAGEYELGYWLGKAYWGRGYATEAARALVAWGRQELAVTKLTAGHFEDNPASARVLEKIGFRPTGGSCPRFSLGRGASAVCVDFEFALSGQPVSVSV